MNIKYKLYNKNPGVWRDGCVLRNDISRQAKGEVIILTHPDLLLQDNAIEEAYKPHKKNSKNKIWVAMKTYWISKSLQNEIDKWKWKSNLNNLKKHPNFYRYKPASAGYTNKEAETTEVWESEVFSSYDTYTWSNIMCGFREFKEWGMVDIDSYARRQILGIKTHVIMNQLCYHQYHESPREYKNIIKKAQFLCYYKNTDEAQKAGGLCEK